MSSNIESPDWEKEFEEKIEEAEKLLPQLIGKEREKLEKRIADLKSRRAGLKLKVRVQVDLDEVEANLVSEEARREAEEVLLEATPIEVKKRTGS